MIEGLVKLDSVNYQKLLDQVEEHVKNAMGADCTGHDWLHVDRVRNMALHINNLEGCESDISAVEIAALLHDIGDGKFNQGVDVSAVKSRDLILKFSEDGELAEKVSSIVSSVSHRSGIGKLGPTSLECQIVQDADRLDAIGAIGIARAFAFGGFSGRKIYDMDVPARTFNTEIEYRNHVGTSLNHFFEKLLLIPARLNTRSAQQIGEKRMRFMRSYLKEFSEECNIDISKSVS